MKRTLIFILLFTSIVYSQITVTDWTLTGTASIVTGNGFNGNALRVVNPTSSYAQAVQESVFETIGAYYEATLTYRCNKPLKVKFGENITTLDTNTQSASTVTIRNIVTESLNLTFVIQDTTTDTYFEIDNISVKNVTGNHLTQSTATNQPLAVDYNTNYSAVRFDGMDDIMKTLTFSLYLPYTVYMVFKRTHYDIWAVIFDSFVAGKSLLFQNSTATVLTKENTGASLGNITNNVGEYSLVVAEYPSGNSDPVGFTLGSMANGTAFSRIEVVFIAIKQGTATFNEDFQIRKYIKAKFGIAL